LLTTPRCGSTSSPVPRSPTWAPMPATGWCTRSARAGARRRWRCRPAAAVEAYLADRAARAGPSDCDGPLLATAGGGRLRQTHRWELLPGSPQRPAGAGVAGQRDRRTAGPAAAAAAAGLRRGGDRTGAPGRPARRGAGGHRRADAG
jgi:hypothetical protein